MDLRYSPFPYINRLLSVPPFTVSAPEADADPHYKPPCKTVAGRRTTVVSLSKNRIKYIRSLDQKKVRKADRVFLAEGTKLVGDLLGRLPCPFIAATADWLRQHPTLPAAETVEASPEEIARASLLKTPPQVLAVFAQPTGEPDPEAIRTRLCLALDDVQDPGNLGTIVRLADWFGIEHIFCSPGTADVYNPKTVQATMGALARVRLHYAPLPQVIRQAGTVPVFGTFLDGNSLYDTDLPATGLIVMGNEGNGIGREVEALVSHRLHIPSYPLGRDTGESLNVAVATAIVCAEFRRRASSR